MNNLPKWPTQRKANLTEATFVTAQAERKGISYNNYLTLRNLSDRMNDAMFTLTCAKINFEDGNELLLAEDMEQLSEVTQSLQRAIQLLPDNYYTLRRKIIRKVTSSMVNDMPKLYRLLPEIERHIIREKRAILEG